jgi:hypothetical protein
MGLLANIPVVRLGTRRFGVVTGCSPDIANRPRSLPRMVNPMPDEPAPIDSSDDDDDLLSPTPPFAPDFDPAAWRDVCADFLEPLIDEIERWRQRRPPAHSGTDITDWLVDLTYSLHVVAIGIGNPKPNFRLSGPVRTMAYHVALGTGFRVKELRTLTPVSFDLDGNPPTVKVAAAYSKRRRQDVQPIRRDLADTLRPWLAQYDRDQRLFRLPHNTSKMLQRDLAAARNSWIEEAQTDTEKKRRNASDFLRYEDTAGRVADFHALRHTYISGLVASGASVKTAQELARHSTPVLTIGRYSHTRLHDLTGALDALPNLPSPDMKNTPEATVATGTGNTAPESSNSKCGSKCSSSKAAECGETRVGRDEPERPKGSELDGPKLLQSNALGDNRRDGAGVVRGGVEPPTHGFSVLVFFMVFAVFYAISGLLTGWNRVTIPVGGKRSWRENQDLGTTRRRSSGGSM